jgi:nicotinamide mononucleotide transporter
MNWIEAVATIFGVIAVWLVVKRHIWCWPTGLVQVILYVGIFYHAKLYSDMILHVIYIFMQLYGWYHWLNGDGNHHQLPVTNTGKAIWHWVVVTVLGTLAWGATMANLTDASLPYPDAFTTVASLVAQWLTARKKLESWLFWIVVDVVAVFIYYQKALYFTTGLYLIFLVLAVYGWWAWKNTMEHNPEPNSL